MSQAKGMPVVEHKIRLTICTEGLSEAKSKRRIHDALCTHVLEKRYVGMASHIHKSRVIQRRPR